MAETKTYAITCTGAGGSTTQSTTVTVTVLTPEPTPTPTPTPSPSDKFLVGDTVKVNTLILSVRKTAGGSWLGYQRSGNSGKVVDGPVRVWNLNWWKIDYASGADGWSAEDFLKK